MTVMEAPTRTRWTAARYLSLPDDGQLYEVLNGELIIAAAPTLQHQDAAFNLAEAMRRFVRSHRLGRVFIAPVDVVLGDDLAEPDVVFVSKQRLSILSRERINGAPDLVVEVLSLSTSARDLRYKWDLYARSGVREYWVVNPEAETVEVLTLEGGVYRRLVLARGQEKAESKVLEGFSVTASEVFAE